MILRSTTVLLLLILLCTTGTAWAITHSDQVDESGNARFQTHPASLQPAVRVANVPLPGSAAHYMHIFRRQTKRHREALLTCAKAADGEPRGWSAQLDLAIVREGGKGRIVQVRFQGEANFDRVSTPCVLRVLHGFKFPRPRAEVLIELASYQLTVPDQQDGGRVRMPIGKPVVHKTRHMPGLHLAVLKGNVRAVGRMVLNGADLQSKDERERTALDIAKFYGDEEMAKVLEAQESAL